MTCTRPALGITIVSMNGNKNYLPRTIDAAIEECLGWRGAVCIEGPKWCGKTWTCRQQAASEFLVGAPDDNYLNRRLCESNPLLALSGEVPHLIDEWQEVPGIWDAVRMEVDRRGGFGHFLLTGSSTPRPRATSHSGTGRITKLRMRTMSLYESGESDGTVSLRSLFDGGFEDHLVKSLDVMTLSYLIIRGGWPGLIGCSERIAMRNAADYIQNFLDEDLSKVDDRSSREKDRIRILLKSLARNEATTASVSKIASDIYHATDVNIKHDTVNEYLDLLGRCFLIEDQPPFTFSARSSLRLKKAPKRHLTDPSLAAALLDLSPAKLVKDPQTMGFLFEALVERDLDIYAKAIGGKLYHYQDYNNKEADAVVQLSDGRWGAFEIKLGSNSIDGAAQGLVRLKAKIEADSPDNAPSFLAVIAGTVGAAYKRPDGVHVFPLTSLKP